ncbi:MAG: PD-(D/E)XK nuclease family transposase [Coriobacteriales bacterium]|jgi:hypothetical protein|nr:PD-(D/E)XK nuclease family transposase [Coriobacteriales bacterium]
MPRYAPTNNLLFLKCFASPENADVLAGFIQDVLGLPVAEATVENPYDVRRVRERLAHTVVDVLARLGDGSLVTIEMQVQPQRHFAGRALYYAASRYVAGYGRAGGLPALPSAGCAAGCGGEGGGGTPGAPYASLRPVFGINVCDFDLFPGCPDPLRCFGLFDTTYQTEFPGPPLHVSFLQLRKEALPGQKGLARWLSFFRGEEPAEGAPAYIGKARRAVLYANLDEKEREMIDYAEMSRADAQGQLEYAWDEGMAQGMARGISQTAARMLAKGIEPDTIRDITGLDAEAIRLLGEN